MDNIILSRRWVQGTPVTIDNLTGTAFTGEAQAHTFRISGVDAAGADVQITGTVTGAFLAPNNTTIPLTGTLTDGVAEVTLTSQCYELPGRFILSVYAANGDTNLCIYCGVGYVFCTETDQVAYPSAAIPDISQLIQEAQDVIDSIPEDYSALSAHFPATGKFVVGTNTSATEENAVAEGEDTIASGLSSHAEGYSSEASGDYSHSEGGSVASGGYSHAEGSASEASGDNAHAEGYETTASSDNSHSEGWGTTASGMNAHAEGVDTVASGNQSHAEGEGTIANHAAQSVSGTYNVADPSQAAATAKGNYAEIVGNGTADNARSNARTLDWSGNEELAGDLTINKNGANEMTVGEELSDLKSIIESDVAEITDKMTAVKSYNAIVDSNIKYGYAYTIYGVQSANASYNCTDQMIPVEPGDVIRFYSNNTPSEARIITVYTQDKTPWGGGAGQDVEEFTVPDNIYWINVTYYASIQLPMLTINYEATDYLNGGNWYNATPAFMPTILSSNVLNTSELLAEHSLTASGGVVENTAYATTGFIPVENSECLVATFDRGLTITLARVVAYDDAKNVIASAGATSVDEYTVPAGVSFIRFCATNAYLTDPTARVSLNGVHEHYSPYVHGRTDRIIDKNGLEISNVLRYPFTTMRQDIVHNLAYKPLGPLSKGYVCVVSDDGNADVATYTIPMFIQKGVPCTLAMMKDSGVFGTTEGTNIVLDAVNNHDFCVAQHGGLYWTTYYDEYTLSKFFDSEKTFWDSLGITPYGACSPGHQCNDMIRAMTGGRFGCHRAAYFDGAPWYGDTMYINGPRSNMYSLTSQNIIESTIDYWKQKCDITLSNKWLMMIHLHEVELTADSKAKLEALIDYALSIGLEFVTMKDIPTIV